MQKKLTRFINALPYQKDRLNLPVANVKDAIAFYQTVLGFKLISMAVKPLNLAILQRDHIQIGLAENGGDPSQDGCFFEVDDVESLHHEFNERISGYEKSLGKIKPEKHNNIPWRIFYVVAPDGLCYSFGQRQS